MIRDTVLRKVVGANFFFAPARANLSAPLCAIFLRFLSLLVLQRACAQGRECALFFFDLAAAVLAPNDHASWDVHHLHGRVSGVYALPAGTARARDFDP